MTPAVSLIYFAHAHRLAVKAEIKQGTAQTLIRILKRL
jgi:energy-converting hydrogenase Eha subunit E